MARNQEKQEHSANWGVELLQEAQKDNFQLPERRPRRADEVTDGNVAKKWWRTLQREIATKIARIQNAALPEQEIRDLNSEINQLIHTRTFWDVRVKELTGEDVGSQQQVSELDGKELYTHSGYKYFGAAKDLPGVRESFEQQKQEDVARRKTRAQLKQHILPDYYGWRDEDDGVLLAEEEAAERLVDEEMDDAIPEAYREMLALTGEDGQKKQPIANS